MYPRFIDPAYYQETGWNLNNLPFVGPSVLRHVNEIINGMNVPWLYLGCLFATFAWHNEDHYVCSMNYLHYGEGKTWYGVPGHYSPEFERALAAAAAAAQRSQGKGSDSGSSSSSSGSATTTSSSGDGPKRKDEVIYELLTVVSPAVLRAGGVPVCHLVQEPGEFVITMPQAYHSGFSHGFNLAEACNFAIPEWLPYGRRAVERYRTAASELRPLCFSHEQLVMNLARHILDHPVMQRGM